MGLEGIVECCGLVTCCGPGQIYNQSSKWSLGLQYPKRFQWLKGIVVCTSYVFHFVVNVFCKFSGTPVFGLISYSG